MEQLQLQDAFGIITSAYQKKTSAIVEEFLIVFGDVAKRASGANGHKALKPLELAANDTPFSIRVNENPPSAQITQYPKGGQQAGVARIKRKMIPPEFMPAVTKSGIALPNQCMIPESAIAIADITDLTRELIIITLNNKTIVTIISRGLLRPEEVSQLLKLLKEEHPEHFVAVQRYLLGVEPEYDIQVPFSVVPPDDEKTFRYLTDLPSQLV